MNRFSKAIAPYVAFAMISGPGVALAGDNYVDNFFRGIGKGIVGAIAQIPNAKNLGDLIGRPAVKLIDEIGHGIAGQNSGRSVDNPGKFNEALESNLGTKIIRDSVAGFAIGYGIAGINSTWEAARNVGAITAGGIATVDAVDYGINNP